MAETDRYRCPRCCDSMNLKFTRSHERICRWLWETIIEPELNRLLA